MTPEELSTTVADALRALVQRGAVGVNGELPAQVSVERPRSKEHGDYATNVALQLGKQVGLAPRELATLLADELSGYDGIAAVDIAGPGFINITVEAAAQGELARSIVRSGASYGDGDSFAGRNVNVEFVSANPTGPVTLASARWAAMGDSLARILESQGASVTKEYYFNDAGAQIDRFSASLMAAAKGQPAPEDGYVGAYIADIAATIVETHPDVLSLPADEAQEAFRVNGVELMFDEVKQRLHDFGVDFDVYFSERSLHESGAVDAAIERLRAGGLTYQADGAVWLRSTEFGDDKDRVIIRSDGRPTYICSDAAYYLDKRARGADLVMIILGADHHGYVGRYRALAGAFGDDPDHNLELVIGQMVNLLRDGEPLRMSKRAGTVLMIDDLVDAIGVDAGRYALVRYSNDSTIDIDIDLWTRQKSDNPVYYVQYAHARLCRIEQNAADLGIALELDAVDPALLSRQSEQDLLLALADFPAAVAAAAELREPHRVARYLEATASTLHRFYEDKDGGKVLPQGDEAATDLHRARLLLVTATRVVFARGLSLLGVSAPERM
jgi:arginyl-tRNA synthetase